MSRYDMSALMEIDLFDAAGAAQKFSNRQDFWVALTNLCSNADRYLRDYTPSVVIYGEEIQREFLKEAEEVGRLLASLHVKSTPSVLERIIEAIAGKEETALADLLRVFHAEMEILCNRISDTLTPDSKASIQKPAEMPVIMLVDDMPEALTSVSEMLLEKYRVIALPDAKSAIRALITKTPALFLLDIEMPEINGYELAKYIRSIDRFAATPILFLSGKGTREHVLAAMVHGGSDYLLKPVDKNALLKKVKQYLKKESAD